MRISFEQLAAVGLGIGLSVGFAGRAAGQTVKAAATAAASAPATQARTDGEITDPVADPKAVVTVGNARFTVLTPELIRMEWAADGKFEDHASFVFLNRRLPVPKFEHGEFRGGQGTIYTIETPALKLTYGPVDSAGADNRFTAENLKIELTLDGKPVVWHPGMTDPDNLQGTTRTLDGALGSKTQEPMEQGLVSRSGWALVDDSTRPLFDSADFRFLQGEKSPWPWVMERPAGERQDWYFFGYGHDYRKALGDFVRVAGRIPLPPRFAFGAWWSRYWAYSDQELDELVRGFHENDVPLDVFVIDMDWHVSADQLRAQGEVDQSGEGMVGVHVEQAAVSRPGSVSRQAPRRGFEGDVESTSGFWCATVGAGLSRNGQGDGDRSGDEEICAVRHYGQEVCDQLHELAAPSAGEARHRFLVAGLAAETSDQRGRRETHLVAQLCSLY